MQKVEGSSPFSRLTRKPRLAGFFCVSEEALTAVRPNWAPESASVARRLLAGTRCPISLGVNADRATLPIEVHAPDGLSPSERGEIRERFARLVRDTDEPIEELRLTLRHPETRTARLRWVADASLVLGGRRLAAHTAESHALPAAKEAADRLERQMRRVADAPVALRNDRRAIQRALAHLAHEHKHRPRP
ncbi:MAG: hypothetical protein QOG59_1714, partial [Solirubrobacteraceae bacterium]|nr:hypothetical protein [Solirubrobacteraceae bacterium]